MRRLALFAILLTACAPPEADRFQAIIGAVLIDGTGAPPLPYAVVVIDGDTIRAVGDQARTPIPPGARKIRGEGKYVVPALVDRESRAPAPVSLAGHGSALEAIAAATRETATPVEPGRPANLMLVAADPLENLENLRKVDRLMLAGRWAPGD